LGIGALAGGPLGAGIGLGVGLVAGAATPIGADQAAKQAMGWKTKEYAEMTGQPAPAASGTSQPPPAHTAGAPLHVSPDTVKHIQTNLQAQNLYTGPIDGIVGPKTKSALREYQQREGLTPTGQIDTTTLQRLGGSASLSKPAAASSGTSSGQMMTTDQVTGVLQDQGYSDISDIRPSGRSDYTALAKQDDTTYVVALDGRTGKVLSRRPAPAGVQPSSGTTQPSGQNPAPTQPDQQQTQ
jgi:peptidoglycan hydrolase-like protein with peptidoglycan-binding domain